MCGQRQLRQDHREPPWQFLVLAAKALLLHYNTTRYALIFQSKHFSTRSTTGHPIVQHIVQTCSVLACLKQFWSKWAHEKKLNLQHIMLNSRSVWTCLKQYWSKSTSPCQHGSAKKQHSASQQQTSPHGVSQLRALNCHTCHTKWSRRRRFQMPRLPQKQARHQSQPSAISATPATQSEVDVTKCHACHTEWTSTLPNATPATQTATWPKRASRGSPVP